MSQRKTYKHVAVIGIDGMGIYNRLTPTPCMDQIFEQGAVTWDARSLDPTISAQNWGAMLIGTNPEVHGLTNAIVSLEPYRNAQWPTVFTRIREKMPQARLATMTCWGPITTGIVEPDLDMTRVIDRDTPLTDSIVACVTEEQPTFLFVQLDEVDGAGHRNGYGTPGHLEQITYTDGLVGRIHDAYEKAGILKDTLFLVIADHGGIRTAHGGYTPDEYMIFLGVAGESVEADSIGPASTRDVAAIVLYALGLEIPAYTEGGFTSQVPDGIFPETRGTYRYTPPSPIHIENKPTPDFRSEKGLASFISEDRIKLALFMDHCEVDATGKHQLKEIGLVKHYSEGVYGARGEFGATGCLVAENLKLGEDSYSVAVWVKIDRSIDEPCPVIFATKSWDWWRTRGIAGICMALRSNSVIVTWGAPVAGAGAQEIQAAFPESVSDGWIHVLLIVDREKGRIRICYNFKQIMDVKLDDWVNATMDNLPFTIGDDPLQTNNKQHNMLLNMDDFLVFGDALTEEDVAKLAQYYDTPTKES